MRPRTRPAGNLNTPMSRLDRMTSWVVLSSARPKNALQSPGAGQRGVRRPAGTGLGGSQRTGAHSLADEAAHAVGESLAPRQAAAVGRHLGERELDLGREALSDPHAQTIAPSFTRALHVEHALRTEVLTLGVGRREVREPPRDLVIVTPA